MGGSFGVTRRRGQPSRSGTWRPVWFTITALLGGGCDLGTKAWSVDVLSALPGQAMTIVAPWLELALAYNRGTAFGVLSDLGLARTVLGVLSLAAVVFLGMIVVRVTRSTTEAIALGMIAGGAIGNGVDRLFRSAPGGGTGVVDFIKVNYPWGGSWPTFNVADVLIAAGAAVWILAHLLWKHDDRAAPSGAGHAT